MPRGIARNCATLVPFQENILHQPGRLPASPVLVLHLSISGLCHGRHSSCQPQPRHRSWNLRATWATPSRVASSEPPMEEAAGSSEILIGCRTMVSRPELRQDSPIPGNMLGSESGRSGPPNSEENCRMPVIFPVGTSSQGRLASCCQPGQPGRGPQADSLSPCQRWCCLVVRSVRSHFQGPWGGLSKAQLPHLGMGVLAAPTSCFVMRIT